MISLISGFWEKLVEEQHKTVRVLFVGVDGSGKSTIVEVLKRWNSRGDESSSNDSVLAVGHVEPTKGLNSCAVVIDGIDFRILDLGGGKDMRVLWRHYYKDTDRIVFVVDGCSIHDRGREVEEFYGNIKGGW